ncbi:MAG: hypothetical protein ACXV5T_08670, partial [Halobacteriota archaeon]
ELPSGSRVQFANPAGLKRIEPIRRCWSVLGNVERGGGGRCTHETLFDRHDINVRLARCIENIL